MSTYLTPGLYFETVDTGRTRTPAIRTDIAAFIGVAARGPVHVPTPIHSWAQFQARFGNFIPGAFLAYSVKAFFENGGDECHIVRVAAGIVTGASDPAAIQPTDRTASIVLSTQGFVPGAVVTVRQSPDLEEDALLAAADPVLRTLTWSHPLRTAFNVTNPMTFETGAAAASATLLDAAGQPTLRVTAESPGTWGNTLTISVAHSSHAATRTRAGVPQPPAGDSTFVESVVGIAPRSLIKSFQDQSPAPPVIHYHTGSPDPTGKRIVWNTPLEPDIDLAQPIDFETVEFSLGVFQQGRLVELFAGISLVPDHGSYVTKAISADTSNYVRVEDLSSPSPLPNRLPSPGMTRLRAGRDGTSALRTQDFTGDPGSDQRWGLRTLEEDPAPAAVAIPDILMQAAPPVEFAPIPPPQIDPCLPCSPQAEAPPAPPSIVEGVPGFGLDDIARVQQTLVEHCEAMRYRIAVLDSPQFSTGRTSVDFAEIQTWRQRFDSKFGALYFPWLLVYDPLQPRGRVVRAIPPSGHVAGTYARTDYEKGVHYAPANIDVRWAQDVTVPVDAARQGVLNPLGINCIRTFPGRGLLLYGARTISSQPAWIFLNVRRLMILIEESLEDALQWVVFEPNNQALRQTLTLTITSFLSKLWEQGALKGTTAGDAFFVRCNDTNNPRALSDNGQLLAEIGMAPSIPAEFVVFRIGRTGDVLGVTE